MNIPQEQLNQWAAFADEVRSRTLKLAARAPEPAREELIALHMTAARLLSQMEEAGASTPDYLTPPLEVPLHLLDTPANRKLAHVLRDAYEAALEVDRERGYEDDGPAEILADYLQGVEVEVYGPSGKGEGLR